MKTVHSTIDLFGVQFLLGVFILSVWGSAPLWAQTPSEDDRDRVSRMHAGLALGLTQPLGEFQDHVRLGGGLLGHFRVALDPRGLVSLRIDGGFLMYGNETQRVCLSPTVGCRIEVDLTTSNNIVLLSVGPEVSVPAGAARLYGKAGIGGDYFFTSSHVQGDVQNRPFATTRNFSDGGLAWTTGGGVEIPVARARGVPIALDLGLSYQRNGRREYLTRGDIIDLPDGSIAFDAKRSDANFLLWRVGVSVGLPSRR